MRHTPRTAQHSTALTIHVCSFTVCLCAYSTSQSSSNENSLLHIQQHRSNSKTHQHPIKRRRRWWWWWKSTKKKQNHTENHGTTEKWNGDAMCAGCANNKYSSSCASCVFVVCDFERWSISVFRLLFIHNRIINWISWVDSLSARNF